MWSSETLKKPWIWPAWRSIETTRSTPAISSASATSLAVIGSPGAGFFSCREYGNHGTTAVIRFAEASFAAWIMISSSTRWSFTGRLPDWMMKTSAPRIDSRERTYVSPFANVFSSTSPSVTLSRSAIRSASSGFERPEKSISRFCGPRSIQGLRSATGSTGSMVSRPGSVASAILLSPSPDVAFLVLLPRARDRERLRRDIVGDDRSRRDPSIVANLDRRNEGIVDPGPDVAADFRPAFRPAFLVRIVHSAVSRRAIRVRAALCVSDVRLVGHLRALAEVRVLDLHERACFGAGRQHGSRAKVTEWPDQRIGADLGIDHDRVGADFSACCDLRRAPQHRERLDGRVRLELDGRVDPGRLGVDDGRAGEHVRLVDPVA